MGSKWTDLSDCKICLKKACQILTFINFQHAEHLLRHCSDCPYFSARKKADGIFSQTDRAMYSNVQDFLTQYAHESASTQKLLKAVSDTHFNVEPNEHVRSTGRLSWHIGKAVSSIGSVLPISMKTFGDADKPSTAAAAADIHRHSSEELLREVGSKINNDMLGQEVNFYGWKMPISQMLWTLISHEVHHRGQLQVVMRMVGDMPVGVAGPTDEEMKAMMAQQN